MINFNRANLIKYVPKGKQFQFETITMQCTGCTYNHICYMMTGYDSNITMFLRAVVYMRS